MEISGKTYGALGHFPTIVGLLRLKLGQRPAKSANVKVPNSTMWGKSVMEISGKTYCSLGHFPTVAGLLRLKHGQFLAKSANVKVPNPTMWGKKRDGD